MHLSALLLGCIEVKRVQDNAVASDAEGPVLSCWVICYMSQSTFRLRFRLWLVLDNPKQPDKLVLHSAGHSNPEQDWC